MYADDVLTYDSRLEEYGLLALSVTSGLNKAGTATITMPPGHPAYDSYISRRSVVTIYRDGLLVFRGRALYPTDDFYKRRTITCEGERGFFLDGVLRPYLYQDTPEAIFSAVVTAYNAQVEAFKQFKVGTVTVTDPNNYIRFESTKAEKISVVLDQLVERCGGYIVFTTNHDGQRVVNWYEETNYANNQSIEFGVNLTDFVRGESDADIATVIIPYGAKDEETGEPITIESVNDGLDYIVDEEARALRGWIAEAVYWDDVTEPINLLRKAQQYLATRRNAITRLELTAVDLSAMDKSFATLRVGDLIHVKSKPHGVDEHFLLTERTEDLLNPDPAAGSVTLGKESATMTGMGVAGDKANANQLQQTEARIRADYQLSIANTITEAKQTLTSLIQQMSDAIKLEVSETYTTNDELTGYVGTQLEQLKDSFNFTFSTLEKKVGDNDIEFREQFQTIEKYIRFVDGNILLGEEGNEVTLRIENDRISFLLSGAEVAYFSNNKLTVTDGHFLTSLRIGPVAFIPRENGNISLVKVVD
jgi:phage minor structural protein